MENLRKSRLLLEDFPKNHNLILVGQVELLSGLDLAVNQGLKSRVTYCVIKQLSIIDDRAESTRADMKFGIL